MSKIANAKHARTEDTPLHLGLKSRATAALTAGCLALSLCPAVALAAPFDMQGSDGNAPAMQQGPGGQMGGQFGQDDQQFGEQPSDRMDGGFGQDGGFRGGGFGQDGNRMGGHPGGDDFDDQARRIMSDEYGVDTSMPDFGQAPEQPSDGSMPEPGQMPEQPSDGSLPDFGQDGQDQTGQPGQPGSNQPGQFDQNRPGQGQPGQAPELPEGAVNVQKVIDSTRDAFLKYSADELENADYSDTSFTKALSTFLQSMMEQREALFQSGGKPADLAGAPSGKAPEQTADTSEQPTGEAPSADTLSAKALGNLIGFVMSVFGYTTAA